MDALVATIAFDGIDITVFYLFHDAYMVSFSVLTNSFFVPVKEDDITRLRRIAPICPLTSLNKPICTDTTTGKLWDDTSIDVPTLVGTPGNKSGTPGDTDVIVTSAGHFTNNCNL